MKDPSNRSEENLKARKKSKARWNFTAFDFFHCLFCPFSTSGRDCSRQKRETR